MRSGIGWVHSNCAPVSKLRQFLQVLKIGTAFWAGAFQADFDGGRDDGPAHGAPENLLKARHMHGPRAVPLLPLWGTGFRFSGASHTLATVVLISTLSVFSFGHLWLITSRESGRLQRGEAESYQSISLFTAFFRASVKAE